MDGSCHLQTFLYKWCRTRLTITNTNVGKKLTKPWGMLQFLFT